MSTQDPEDKASAAHPAPLQERFPLLPVRNAVIFPGISTPIVVAREKSVEAIYRARARQSLIVLATQKVGSVDEPSAEQMYTLGVLCKLDHVAKNPGSGLQVTVSGLQRFEINHFDLLEDHWAVTGRVLPEIDDAGLQLRDLYLSLKAQAGPVLARLPGVDENIMRFMQQILRPDLLANVCAFYLTLQTAEKQAILELSNATNKLERVLTHMQGENDALHVKQDLRSKVTARISKSQREAFLREQMRTIRDELGEGADHQTQKLRDRVAQAQMPPDIEQVALLELTRLETLPPSSSEFHVLLNYLEWLTVLPWTAQPEPPINLEKARELLDRKHYGLTKVKRRILQSLAVAKLKGDVQGNIICLVGPPGVGKTSLGQSVADALGRKFIRASLGGVTDESEIRGHRRTYVGAMPGRIVQSLKRAGTTNPVMLLDEIDKLGYSYQGDPAAALLEVLDPEQNSSFLDRYLDVPIDLSRVFFLATANVVDNIPGPLRDRLEMIEVSGYTQQEKEHIATEYLIPKKLNQCGVKSDQVSIEGKLVKRIIEHYTREAGVRNLDRKFAEVARYCAEAIVEGKPTPIVLNENSLVEVLGPENFLPEVLQREVRPGVATGLAWTSVGGEILFIEVTGMPGSGQLLLTGQLGDVMKESAQIALSFLKSQDWPYPENFSFKNTDLHIHFPAGAIPKDGPSAGVTMITALASLIFNRRVEPRLAMTGEVTLRGAVLPVGGIKEKVLAAHRAGVKSVILPALNRNDVTEVPSEVREALNFHYVESVEEVLTHSLHLRREDLQSLPPTASQVPYVEPPQVTV